MIRDGQVWDFVTGEAGFGGFAAQTLQPDRPPAPPLPLSVSPYSLNPLTSTVFVSCRYLNLVSFLGLSFCPVCLPLYLNDTGVFPQALDQPPPHGLQV